MKLHDLRARGRRAQPRTRVGRGIAAGKGKTAGRGTKGQKARAGGSIPAWFEGGQTPLHMRIPKLRGFKNPFKVEYEIVNLGDIGQLVELGALESGEMPGAKTAPKQGGAPITINQEILRAAGLVRTLDKPLKILGGGELSTALFVVADAFSEVRRSPRSRRPAARSTSSRSRPRHVRRSASTREKRDRPQRRCASRPSPRDEDATADSARARPPKTRAPRRRSRGGRQAPSADAETTAPRRDATPDAAGRDGRSPEARRPTTRRPRTPTAADVSEAVGRRRAQTSRPPTVAGELRSPTPTSRRRRVADRVRIPAQRLPRAGHPATAAVRPRDPDRLPVPGPCAGAGRRPGPADAVLPEQRRCSASSTCSRAAGCRASRSSALGREPVHQRLDHHAADDGRHPLAPGAQREGEYGRNKINQYTRYLAVPMALLQAYGFLALLNSQGVLSSGFDLSNFDDAHPDHHPDGRVADCSCGSASSSPRRASATASASSSSPAS